GAARDGQQQNDAEVARSEALFHVGLSGSRLVERSLPPAAQGPPDGRPKGQRRDALLLRTGAEKTYTTGMHRTSWRPRRESNPDLPLRRGPLYPFNYRGVRRAQ